MNTNKSANVQACSDIGERAPISFNSVWCATAEETSKHFNEILSKVISEIQMNENELELAIEEQLEIFCEFPEYKELQQIYEMICKIESFAIRIHMKEAFSMKLLEFEGILSEEGYI